MKRILNGRVVENIEIADKVYRLVVNAPEAVRDYVPGRFVNLYPKDKSLLLPRPVSICEIREENMVLVYGVVGKGTSEFADYDMGDRIRISTPMGNGFQINPAHWNGHESNRSKELVVGLVGGGIGVPPLAGLAKSIRSMKENGGLIDAKGQEQKVKTIAFLGFQREPFLVEELEEYCDEVFLATDEGTLGFRGNVMDLINQKQWELDACYACGPKAMLRALTQHCEHAKIPLQISMEERMGCGYGACVGCTCKTKQEKDGVQEITQKKVCKDGPVFLGTEVDWA